MPKKLFIIGRPGSGKTTAADFITSFVKSEHFLVQKFNDYDILRQMSHIDTMHSRFLPTEHDGFDVIDFSVLDEALQMIEQVVKASEHSYNFVTIEFARDGYDNAMRLFSEDFLRDSYFIYLETSVEICLTRIHDRVAISVTSGDHPSLSDKKFREYYGANGKQYIETTFKTEYDLEDGQVIVIQNEGTKKEFTRELEQYFNDTLLKVIKSD